MWGTKLLIGAVSHLRVIESASMFSPDVAIFQNKGRLIMQNHKSKPDDSTCENEGARLT
jgi:hypothetical protein